MILDVFFVHLGDMPDFHADVGSIFEEFAGGETERYLTGKVGGEGDGWGLLEGGEDWAPDGEVGLLMGGGVEGC